eukprot:4853444-Ditylum_brightwellii.AAC.1
MSWPPIGMARDVFNALQCLAYKKRGRAWACTGTRTKCTHTIKKFLVHADSLAHVPDNETEKEYDNDTRIDTSETLPPEGTSEEANKFFTWAQN